MLITIVSLSFFTQIFILLAQEIKQAKDESFHVSLNSYNYVKTAVHHDCSIYRNFQVFLLRSQFSVFKGSILGLP